MQYCWWCGVFALFLFVSWGICLSLSPRVQLAQKISWHGFVTFSIIFTVWQVLWWNDPFRRFSTEIHLMEWLEACPSGGVRFVANSKAGTHLYGYANPLKSDLARIGSYGVGGDDYNTGRITVTLVPGEIPDTQMSPQQEIEIERLIQGLPSRKMGSPEKYDFNNNIYFATWKDHALETYVYSKDNLPVETMALLEAFGPSLVKVIMETQK
jgi:hypothetical protein